MDREDASSRETTRPAFPAEWIAGLSEIIAFINRDYPLCPRTDVKGNDSSYFCFVRTHIRRHFDSALRLSELFSESARWWDTQSSGITGISWISRIFSVYSSFRDNKNGGFRSVFSTGNIYSRFSLSTSGSFFRNTASELFRRSPYVNGG